MVLKKNKLNSVMLEDDAHKMLKIYCAYERRDMIGIVSKAVREYFMKPDIKKVIDELMKSGDENEWEKIL